MKGLITKDLINLKKYSRTVLLVTAVYILFAFMMESMEAFSGMIIMIFAVTTVSSFSYDSQSGWEEYALTLPLPRKSLVFSKYLLALLLTVAGALLALILNWLFGLFKHVSNFSEALVTTYAIFAVAVIFLCIMLPLIYRFGAERSRIIILAVFAIPAAALMVLSQSDISLNLNGALFSRILLFSPLVLIAGSVISVAVSCRVFQQRLG